jgi:hypothetical protein
LSCNNGILEYIVSPTSYTYVANLGNVGGGTDVEVINMMPAQYYYGAFGLDTTAGAEFFTFDG